MTSSSDHSGSGSPILPAGLAARPVDPRRKLPIPVVNEYDDGTWDFTAINGDVSKELAEARRCGLCGEKMGWWIAFFGGPASATSGVYSDPPMHPECAEAATRLCPHITRPTMQRAKSSPVEAVTPAGMTLNRPSEWVMWVTRTFQIRLSASQGGAGHGLVVVFVPGPAKRLRRWTYDADGRLRETS